MSAVTLIFGTQQSTFAQLPKVACGSVQRLEKFQSDFIDPRNIDIWLPDSWRNPIKQQKA